MDQRILEQGHRIRAYGAITGWAAMRWRGARFFDGTASAGGETLPVPLVTGGQFVAIPEFQSIGTAVGQQFAEALAATFTVTVVAPPIDTCWRMLPSATLPTR